jgi:hypothetical protein
MVAGVHSGDPGMGEEGGDVMPPEKWRERDKAKVLNTTEDLEKNLAAAQLRAESSKGKALKNAESDIKKYQQGLDTAHTKLTMM